MKRRAFAALAVTMFTAAPATAANQIVVRSTGPSARLYPVGRELPPGYAMNLRAGDSLIVLGQNRAAVFQGPGSFVVRAGDDVQPFRRTRFSIRRGPVREPGPWTIAVTDRGPICADPRLGLSLWRSDADADSRLLIRAADRRIATLHWPSGKSTLPWPGYFPLADGATYRLEGTGKYHSEIRIAAIHASPTNHAETAHALLNRGCRRQLDRLVEQIVAQP